MKKLLLCALLGLSTTLSFAQDAGARDTLYKALGEKPGLVRLMDDFMPRLVADPRTQPFFGPADQHRVKEQLVAQFCQLSGGPCDYQGKDMKTAHMNQRALVAATAATLLASLMGATPAMAQEAKEKCFGVAKAGQNDCASVSGAHSCAGQSKVDMDKGEWKYVAKGTCKALKGWTQDEVKQQKP